MNKWWRYLPAYLPPLAILALLLATNLFTRSKVFRKYVFPEKNIVISAQYAEESQQDAETVPIPEMVNEFEHDTAGCNEPAYNLARASFKTGNYSDAISSWSALLATTTCRRSFIQNSIGIAYLQLGKTQEAEKAFLAATKLDSTYALAWYNLAVCQSRRNRIKDAVLSYTRAVQDNPRLSKAHFNLGILLMKQGQYSEARARTMDALSWGMDKVRCWYAIALSFQREDSLDQALYGYSECIRLHPAHIPARMRMAEIYSTRSELEKAKSIAAEAFQIDPDNPEIPLRLARIASDRKDFEKAFSLLDKAEKRYPGLVEIAYLRARVYGLKGDNKRALAMYKEIIGLDPANPRVYYNIGVNLMELGMEKEALDAYARSLKIDPSYWKTAYNLGVFYLKKNQPLQAEQYFHEAVQITPDRAQAHYNLGIAYLRAGTLNEAMKSFRNAIRLDSNYREAKYNLALTLMKDGQNDSAQTAFQSVLRASPGNAKAFYNLGLLHRRARDNRGADSCLARAIICRKGNYPSAWYLRALCKRDMDEFDSALACVRRATAMPDTEGVPAKALILQAQLFDTLGFRDSADFTLRLADSLCGGDPDALGELAEFYTKHGDTQHTRSVYRRLLLADSTNTDVLLAAAKIEINIGELDTAENLYKRAIGIDGQNPEALTDYAELLTRRKRNDDALRMLQRAIILDPGSADIRLKTALVFFRENRRDDYGREIAKLRSLPMNASLAYSTGKALYRANQYRDAKWFLELAVNEAPGNPDAKYYLLLCLERLDSKVFDPVREWSLFIKDFSRDYRGYFQLGIENIKQGAWSKARELLTKTIEIEDIDDAHFNLAKICHELRDDACAREHAAIYMQRNPIDKKGKKLYALVSVSLPKK